MSGHHNVRWLCEALLVSRSGYYDWDRRQREPSARARANTVLCRQIREEFNRSHERYGSPRIARALGRKGSRNRIARLMHQERIFARQRSKFRKQTTDSHHDSPVAPNLLPAVTVVAPDQAWVTDATAILTGQGWLYVVALLDVFTRRIVGWAMHECLDTPLTLRALEMAVARRRPRHPLIVHSDRGSQFASALYRQALARHHLTASMSRKGNCYDNAFIESFWSSLKYEVVYPRKFATRAEAKTAVFDYIESFYNRVRLHSSLGYVSPVRFESQLTKAKSP
jgi:putative transposase